MGFDWLFCPNVGVAAQPLSACRRGVAGVAGRGEVQSGIMELLCRRGEAGTEPSMPVNSQVQQPWTFTYLFKHSPVVVAGAL